MSDNVVELPSSDVAIRSLHAEIERLATHAAESYMPRTPGKLGTNGAGCEMTYWYDGEHIKVFTCDGTPFISGIEHFGHWPDWYCLPPSEARKIAQALMAAAASVADE